ncbi:MAG: tetratricopeptide repeat protein, partial [Chloroflexota bacterium]
MRNYWKFKLKFIFSSTVVIVNLLLEKYDEAIQNLKQCIDIVDRIGREKKAAVSAYFYLGTIYQTLEQYNDAVYYSKKCIDMAQETGKKKFEAQACYHLGEIYQTLEQYNDALYYGKKCIDMAR